MLLKYAKDYIPLTKRANSKFSYQRWKDSIIFSSSVKAISRFFNMKIERIKSLEAMPEWIFEKERKENPDDILPKLDYLIAGGMNNYTTDEVFITKAYRLTANEKYNDFIVEADIIFGMVDLLTPDGEYIGADCVIFSKDDTYHNLPQKNNISNNKILLKETQFHLGMSNIYPILSKSFSFPFRKDFSRLDDSGYEYALLLFSPRYIEYARKIALGNKTFLPSSLTRFILEQEIAKKITELRSIQDKMLEIKMSEAGYYERLNQHSHVLDKIGNFSIIEFLQMYSLDTLDITQFKDFEISSNGITGKTSLSTLITLYKHLNALHSLLSKKGAMKIFGQIDNFKEHTKFVESAKKLGIDILLESVRKGVPIEDVFS